MIALPVLPLTVGVTVMRRVPFGGLTPHLIVLPPLLPLTQPPPSPVGPCGPTIAGFAWNTAVSGARPVSPQPAIVTGRSDRETVPTAFVQVTRPVMKAPASTGRTR